MPVCVNGEIAHHVIAISIECEQKTLDILRGCPEVSQVGRKLVRAQLPIAVGIRQVENQLCIGNSLMVVYIGGCGSSSLVVTRYCVAALRMM